MYGYIPSGTSSNGAVQGEYMGTGNGSALLGFAVDGNSNGAYGEYTGSGDGYGVVGFNTGTGTGSGGFFSSVANVGLAAQSDESYALYVMQGAGSGFGTADLPAAFFNADTSNALVAFTNDGTGVVGFNLGTSGGVGVLGESDNGGINSYGVIGYTGADDGTGVFGLADNTTGEPWAVWGSNGGSSNALAGQFDGDVNINGTMSAVTKAFRIDHPLDPEHKVLYHSCIESPDMMTVYNGNVTTDADGFARVSLPSYFGALNTELKYQLTCIGTFAQAIIAEEVRDNQFVIQTDKPNVKVSWQVTGVRNDPAARAPHRTRTGKTRTRSRQVHLSGSLRQRPRPARHQAAAQRQSPRHRSHSRANTPAQTSQPPAVAQ